MKFEYIANRNQIEVQYRRIKGWGNTDQRCKQRIACRIIIGVCKFTDRIANGRSAVYNSCGEYNTVVDAKIGGVTTCKSPHGIAVTRKSDIAGRNACQDEIVNHLVEAYGRCGNKLSFCCKQANAEKDQKKDRFFRFHNLGFDKLMC